MLRETPTRDPSRKEGLEQLVRRAVQGLIRNRLATLSITLAIVVSISLGILQLRFNPDSRVFFGNDNPEMVALRNLENSYNATANILFVLRSKDGNIFEPQSLEAIGDMTEASWQIPDTLRVDSLANFNSIRSQNDEITVEPLFEPGRPISAQDASAIRSYALGQKELVNRVVSSSGDVAAILVRIVKPKDAATAIEEMTSLAQRLKREWEKTYPQFDIFITGSIIADEAFEAAGRRDMATVVPLIGVIVFIVLWLGLRSLAATVGTVVTLIAAAAVGMGFAGWMGVTLNTGTVGAPVSITILTLASCIHILITLIKHIGAVEDPQEAIVEAVTQNFNPVIVANVTTAIGFLCLNFSSAPPLRDLGNIVAFGVLAGMIFCLTTMPCLISYRPPTGGRRLLFAAENFERLASMILRHRRLIVLAFVISLPVSVWGVSRITIEDDYIRYFGRQNEFRMASEFTEAHLTGLNVLQYSLPAADKGGIFNPAYLDTVDAFGAWLAAQPNVTTVETVADIVKRVNQTVNGGDPEFYRIEQNAALNAQNLLVYEISLPSGLDLNSVVSFDRLQTRVTAVLANVTSARVRELARTSENWLKERAPAMSAPATGVSVVFAYISERNIRSMIGGTEIALLLISGILLVLLRSVKFGILSLLPNLVPALITFGIWGFLVGQINLGSSIVTTMTLGIVVDDTVYFLLHYVRLRTMKGQSCERAIRTTLSSEGQAIVLTSLALIIGFLVLSTSGFAVNQQLGLLCALTVGSALVADLLFLPAVLTYLDRDR